MAATISTETVALPLLLVSMLPSSSSSDCVPICIQIPAGASDAGTLTRRNGSRCSRRPSWPKGGVMYERSRLGVELRMAVLLTERAGPVSGGAGSEEGGGRRCSCKAAPEQRQVRRGRCRAGCEEGEVGMDCAGAFRQQQQVCKAGAGRAGQEQAG